MSWDTAIWQRDEIFPSVLSGSKICSSQVLSWDMNVASPYPGSFQENSIKRGLCIGEANIHFTEPYRKRDAWFFLVKNSRAKVRIRVFIHQFPPCRSLWFRRPPVITGYIVSALLYTITVCCVWVDRSHSHLSCHEYGWSVVILVGKKWLHSMISV